MIRSFKCKETEHIWQGFIARKLPNEIQHVAKRKLRMLNNAKILMDLRISPNNGLEALTGNRKGQYSIRINGQWRLCFLWIDGGAAEVAIVDYH